MECALYHMARVAAQRDPHFSAVYAALRAKGPRHGQALRNIGDRLLRILIAMLLEVAQFITVCSAQILAEELPISSPLPSQSREKRRAS
jgi:hypothetical protein